MAAGLEAVSLLTMHGAKGLEFDTVFLPMLNEGWVPHRASADDPAALAEERRLFYVALTRARSRVYLTWRGPDARSGDGEGRRGRSRSRFLDDLPSPLLQPLARGPGRRRPRGRQLRLF